MTTATFSGTSAGGSLWREQFLLHQQPHAGLSGWLRLVAALQAALLGIGVASALVLA